MNIAEQLIFPALEEIKQVLQNPEDLVLSLDTELFGTNSALDSMSFVSFIVSLEQIINDKYNKEITIADEKAMSMKNSPFKTVQTLAEYLEKILKD
jgi:acyl carrier protein